MHQHRTGTIASVALMSSAISVGLASVACKPRAFNSAQDSLTNESKSASASDWKNEYFLKEMGILEAWELLAKKGKKPGEGIRIAHIDTGIVAEHPELRGIHFNFDLAYDFYNNKKGLYKQNWDNYLTELSHGQVPNFVLKHSHGTETAAYIGSPAGCPEDWVQPRCVTGVAPAAEIVPIVVGTWPFVLDVDKLSKAIDYAVEIKAHIITMSVGSINWKSKVKFNGSSGDFEKFKMSVMSARNAGVIIIAAGGNHTADRVAAPAAFIPVISVGGSVQGLKPWKEEGTRGSVWGRGIDVSAPALALPFALVTHEEGKDVFGITDSGGTSASAALVAGVTALWMSYHTREVLLAKYSPLEFSDTYLQLLKSSGVYQPEGWPRDSGGKFLYGAGIINAQRLLTAELPFGIKDRMQGN